MDIVVPRTSIKSRERGGKKVNCAAIENEKTERSEADSTLKTLMYVRTRTYARVYTESPS